MLKAAAANEIERKFKDRKKDVLGVPSPLGTETGPAVVQQKKAVICGKRRRGNGVKQKRV